MKRIGFIVLPDFTTMAMAALCAFEVANKRSGETLYEIHVLSENGGKVRNSLGICVETESLESSEYDTLLVGAGMEINETSANMIASLQAAAKRTRRLAAICLGAFDLGQAGLLDGRRVTTHWRYSRELQRRFPNARVEMDKIFVGDGNVWTSAGMSAGIDLALGLVEADHGHDLARAVAKGLVIHHRRAGGQSQHSALLELDAKSDRIQQALAHAKNHLRDSLSVLELADAACLSPRQFTRLFRAETGVSPAKAVESLRLEAAKLMMEQSSLSVETVARESGFGDRERMRRAFIRAFGSAPTKIKATG